MRFSLKQLLLLPPIAILFLWYCDRIGTAYYSGDFVLTVQVDPNIAADVVEVSYLPANGQDEVDAALAAVESRSQAMFARQLVAGAFEMSIPVGGKITWLGHRTHYQRWSHLIVLLEHVDGSQSVHLVEIPERKKPWFREAELSEATMVQRYEKGGADQVSRTQYTNHVATML